MYKLTSKQKANLEKGRGTSIDKPKKKKKNTKRDEDMGSTIDDRSI